MAKKKPCEWCEDDDYGEPQEGRNGFCVWLEVYPYNNLIAFTAQANDEEGAMQEAYVTMPMNYCPNCGRKLEGL